MSQNHYYIADGKVLEKVEALFQRHDDATNVRWDLLDELGAKQIAYWGTGSWGFDFTGKKSPDEKLLRFNKKSECWFPNRSTPAGRALGKRMAEKQYQIPSDGEWCGAVGMKSIRYEGMHFFLLKPGIQKLGNQIVLVVSDDCEPKGCARISDLEYEAMRKKYDKPKKKKRPAKAKV